MRKLRVFKESIRQMWWGAKALLGAVVFAQAACISAIVIIDQVRKALRRHPSGSYPIAPSREIQVDDNSLRTYTTGDAVYADMLQAIREAKHTIFFESFIWKGDKIGKRFKRELINAAKRGVQVYCVWDQFGNLVVSPRFFRFPKLKNLHTLGYPLHHTGRDHRKILCVDSHIGFVGGYNIGDLYTTSNWRDTHIRVQGSAVWELEDAFMEFWNIAQKWRPKLSRLPDPRVRRWNPPIASIVNDPRRLLFPVRGSYVNALNQAVESAYITSAYFVPDRVIQQALINAAKRGVDVKVLVPDKSNHLIADWISGAYLTDLLNAGVEVWRYQDVMIHAKTAVVDGRWCTVGTANIDRLSMTGNHEINLGIASREVAAQMEQIFYTDLTNARQLTRHEWNSRPAIWKLVERILKPLAFFV